MSLQDDVKTVLAANGTLTAAFTGGIKTFDELGTLGLNPNSYGAGFNSGTLKLEPTIVIRERVRVPTPQLADEGLQLVSTVQAVEVWFYTARQNGYSVVESGQATAYGLLQHQVVGSGKLIWRAHYSFERDPSLDRACVCYSVYDRYGVLQA